MDPVAFNLFGMEVRWYGVIISAAMIIGVLIFNKTMGAKSC